MSTLFRLYNSAKSLISSNPKHNRTTNTLETDIEDIGNNTGTQKSNRSRKMGEDLNSENSKPSRQLSGIKRRLRSDQQKGEEMVTISSSKKQKILPLREKLIDNLQTPKSHPPVEMMVENSQSGSEIFLTPMKDLGLCERNGKTIKIGKDSTAKRDFLRDKFTDIKNTPNLSSNHRRFGSEESDTQTFATPMENIPTTIQPNSQEVDDSDDDAPEAVTIHQSERTTKLKTDDSAKSIAAKKLASKVKNRQRQKKRRMHLIKEEISDLNPDYNSANSTQEEESIQQKDYAKIKECSQDSSKISLNSKKGLPDLLPLDYLEDYEPIDDTNPSPKILAHTMRKRIKFNDLSEKKVKDKRVGSTTFRVVKACNKSLAPRAELNARRTKELWLQGRTGKRQECSRVSFSRKFTRV